MFKYQYLIREYAFRLLRRLPQFVQKPLVSLFVARKKRCLEELKTPAQLILYVTNRCNARCSHCFYWQEVAQGIKKELPLNQIRKIAQTLANSLLNLSITGGEPFLRDDLDKICQVFFKFNKTRKINIVTNGYFTKRITKTVKQILKTCPVDLNIQVSLDGLQKAHDEIRKIPVFEKALETIRTLNRLSSKHRNLQVTVLTTITRYNLKEIVPLGKLIREKFPSVHHGFQFVRSASFDVYQIDKKILSGLDPEAKKPLISVKEMQKAFEDFSQFGDQKNSLLHLYVKTMNKGIIRMKKEKKPLTKCLAGKYDGVVWPDGQVSMCEFVKPFAHLRDFDFNFYKLWTSKEAKKMRGKIKTCFCTHTCNLMNAIQFDEKVLMEILTSKNG